MRKLLFLFFIISSLCSTVVAQSLSTWDDYPSHKVNYHHKYRMTNFKHWYNDVGYGFDFGRGTDESVTSTYNHFKHDPKREKKDFGFYANISYAIMRRFNFFYIGPSIVMGYGSTGFTPAACLKMRFDIGGLWSIAKPYVSFAGGLSYYTGDNVVSEFIVGRNGTSSNRYLTKKGNGTKIKAGDGVYNYIEIGAGVTLDFKSTGTDAMMVVGYRAVMRPCVESTFSPSAHSSELYDFWRNGNANNELVFKRDVNVTSHFYHGFFMSFLF